jgi:hypothetical protein
MLLFAFREFRGSSLFFIPRLFGCGFAVLCFILSILCVHVQFLVRREPYGFSAVERDLASTFPVSGTRLLLFPFRFGLVEFLQCALDLAPVLVRLGDLLKHRAGLIKVLELNEA